MNDIEAMIDAAMVEMANMHPPLRRSDCKRLILAALDHRQSSRPAQQVTLPHGWLLVPADATETMVRCMQFRNIETGKRCYRAMLAAAPQPPRQADLLLDTEL